VTNAPKVRDPQVWVTVVDPQTDDGRSAVTSWDKRGISEWAVPRNASHDDFVLAWVTGGTGFRYVLKVEGTPREPANEEFGPRQAALRCQYVIHPSLPMARLKAEPAMRSWWIVRYNMQGVIRAQEDSLTRDPQWSDFTRLLISVDPNVGNIVASVSQATPPLGASAATPASSQARTVSVKDEGEPQVSIIVTPALAAVFARAVEIDSSRDFDLTFSSLFLGLMYGEDSLARWLSEYVAERNVHVEHLFSRVRTDAARAHASARRGMEDQEQILGRVLQRTSSARRALEEASRIAHAQERNAVDSSHLLGALIALTDYHEEDFGALTLDRAQWGAAFVQHMARETADASEIAFWRRFYSRRFPGHELPALDVDDRPAHRPDYDADAYTSRDLLAIDDEVDALAYVIASKQTQPPLAIGLFGEWGSGKTFFMKHLRKRIDLLCQGARQQPVTARECHGHVAQIEFNAWHYQEGDLWASLVDHILRNLRFGDDEEEKLLAERRDQLVRELDTTETRQEAAAARAAEVDAQVGKAEERVSELKKEEKARREELADRLTPGAVLAAVRAGITVNETLHTRARELGDTIGVPELQRNAVELQDALSAAHGELQNAWSFLLPLFRADDRQKRRIFLALAIGVPLVIGVVVTMLLGRYNDLLGRLAGWLTGIGSLIAAVTPWILKQIEWVRRLRTRVESVAREVDKEISKGIESALAEQKKAVADKLAELDSLRREQAVAQKARDDAASQAAELKNTLAILGDDGLMRAFLDDRIGGGNYQKKLGTAALVRRDFERLSKKLEQVTAREAQNALKPNELVINRIVLYIDDLDRCDMRNVVPVLRAVHLLLAFPAFVVVVGVDSRWVARCLATHHPDIFLNDQADGERPVTPLDYLEKIFQIPIWLDPVPRDRRVFMVQELLRKPVLGPASHRPGKPQEPMDQKPTFGTGEPTDDLERAPADNQMVTDSHGIGGAPAPEPPSLDPLGTHEREIELNPKGLSISDGEFEFIGKMGSLLSSSPRTIKRFVNTYRLLNVTLKQAGLDDTDLLPRDSEIRMLLLAVLVDMPALSRRLQAALRGPRAANLALISLIELMDATKNDPDAQNADAVAEWATVSRWLKERGKHWSTMPASRVSEWLDPVGRYTFNLRRATPNNAGPPRSVEGSTLTSRS